MPVITSLLACRFLFAQQTVFAQQTELALSSTCIKVAGNATVYLMHTRSSLQRDINRLP
jgi:hypothetical protein